MPVHKKALRSVKKGTRSARKSLTRIAKGSLRSVKRSFRKQVRGFTRSKSVRDVSRTAKKANPVRGFLKTIQALRKGTKRAKATQRRRPRRR